MAKKTDDAEPNKALTPAPDGQGKKPTEEEQFQKMVDQLINSTAETPEELSSLIDNQELHAKVIEAVAAERKSLKKSLSPSPDEISKGLAQKLSPVDRAKSLHHKAKLDAFWRKLKTSNRLVSKKVVAKSKDERNAILLDMKRDTVKDPNYYNKYGTFIVPAFERLINSPMTADRRDKFAAAKAVPANESEAAIAKILQSAKPDLYIRAIGDKDRKSGYFAEFQRILVEWDPAKANIKPIKQ